MGRTRLIGRVFAGLDIGGTKVLGILVDPDGLVLAQVRLPTVKGCDGVLATASTAVLRILQVTGLQSTAFGAVVWGVTGVGDHAVELVAQSVTERHGRSGRDTRTEPPSARAGRRSASTSSTPVR